MGRNGWATGAVLGAWLGALALGGACSRTPSDPKAEALKDGHLTLRAGVVEVTEGRSWPFGTVTAGQEPIDQPYVWDIAGSPSSLLVASIGDDSDGSCGLAGPTIATSGDGGATWTRHTLSALDTALQNTGYNCAMPVGVSSGGAVALLARFLDYGGHTRYAPAAVDLGSDRLSYGYDLVTGLMSDCVPFAGGDRIHCYDCFQGIGFEAWYDIASRTITHQALACGAGGQDFVESPSGTWVGFQYAGGQVCKITAVAGATATTSLCVPATALKTGADHARMTARGPMMAGSVADTQGVAHAWAMDIVADAGTQSAKAVNVDLGPGRVEPLWGAGLTPHFGTLVAVLQADGSKRLFDLTASGTLEELVLPRTPCASDGSCGSSAELQWSYALGGDRFLDVYLVDSFPPPVYDEYAVTGGHHLHVLAVVDQAVRRTVSTIP